MGNDIRKANKLILIIFFAVSLIAIAIIDKENLLYAGAGDDLTLLNQVRELGYLRFIFDHSYKFRPFSNLFIAIPIAISNGNYCIVGYSAILMSAICATVILSLSYEISKSYVLAVIPTTLFVVSRLSYYQIMQMLGIMECLSTTLSMVVILFCIKFVRDGNRNDFLLSLLSYFLVCFSHERFAVLALPIFLSLLFSEGKLKTKFTYLAMLMGTVLLAGVILFVVTPNPMVGNSGVDVSKSFTMEAFGISFLKCIGYMFFINPDGENLFALLGYTESKEYIKVIAVIQNVLIAEIALLSMFRMIKIGRSDDSDNKKVVLYNLKKWGITLSAIFMTMVIASVTIRVEMRWVFVPYILLTILIIDVVKFLCDEGEIIRELVVGMAGGILVLSTIMNFYYRGYYKNIYFYGDWNSTNTLAKSTYYKYGNDIYSMDWVMLYTLSDGNENFEGKLAEFDLKDMPDVNIKTINNYDDLIDGNYGGKNLLFLNTKNSNVINVEQTNEPIVFSKNDYNADHFVIDGIDEPEEECSWTNDNTFTLLANLDAGDSQRARGMIDLSGVYEKKKGVVIFVNKKEVYRNILVPGQDDRIEFEFDIDEDNPYYLIEIKRVGNRNMEDKFDRKLVLPISQIRWEFMKDMNI